MCIAVLHSQPTVKRTLPEVVLSATNVPFEENHSVHPLRESTNDTSVKAAIEKKRNVLRLIQYSPRLRKLKISL